MLAQVADKEILSLFDLPQNKFYVGISSILETKLRKNIDATSKSFCKFLSQNKMPTSFYVWFKKRELPLCELIKLGAILKLKDAEIEENVTYIRSGRYSHEKSGGILGEKIFFRFPLCLSKELARIIAHVFADGCISIDKNSYITGAYYNQSISLRNEFKKDIELVFKFYNLKEQKNKGTEYFYLPSSISLILLCLAKTYGSKECRIPDFIKNANSEIRREFLGAIFDDESYIYFSPPQRYIELTLCNFGLLCDVQKVLAELTIKTTKIYERKIREFDIFSCYVRGKDNLLAFKKIIELTDPNKNRRLLQIIDNPSRHSRSYLEMKKEVLFALKSGETTVSGMGKKINRSYATANMALKKLKNENIVNNRIKNKKMMWYLE